MRIVYLSSDLIVHDYRFLKKISEAGHEVYLITHYPSKRLPDDIASLKSVRVIKYDSYAFLSDAEKDSLGLRKISSLITSLINFFRFLFDVKRIKPDLIHAGWVQSDGLLGALSGIRPFLLVPFGSDILMVPHRGFLRLLITKFVLNRADMFACDCEYVRNGILKLRKCPEDKIAVFPFGIDLNLFKPNKNVNQIKEQLGWQEKKVIVMTRFFEPVYGIEYFLKALPEVFSICPDTRVILAGRGPLLNDLKQLALGLGINEYIHFAGYVPNNKLPDYYNNADIYVSSSLSDGTSISLLEAMACSLPVVVTDVPSYLEWIYDGENGFVVSRKNSKVLAEKIIHLLRNDDLRKKMGQKNYSMAQERADWDKNYEKLEDIYSKFLKSKIIEANKKQ